MRYVHCFFFCFCGFQEALDQLMHTQKTQKAHTFAWQWCVFILVFLCFFRAHLMWWGWFDCGLIVVDRAFKLLILIQRERARAREKREDKQTNKKIHYKKLRDGMWSAIDRHSQRKTKRGVTLLLLFFFCFKTKRKFNWLQKEGGKSLCAVLVSSSIGRGSGAFPCGCTSQ